MNNPDGDALRAARAQPAHENIDQDPPLGLTHRLLVQVEWNAAGGLRP
jgi:hypothetical protein